MTATTPPAEVDERFRGFPPGATKFFAGLEADNTRDYWQSHRHRYEVEVHGPMLALIAQLPERLQPFHVFRMNRDLRFSADKSPYKTQLGAGHDCDGSVHYVQLDAHGLLVAVGAYLMAADQLHRYRAAVDDERTGPELEAVLSTLERGGLTVGDGARPPLVTAPRGYRPDHPRIARLRTKGVIGFGRVLPEQLGDGPAVVTAVDDIFDAAAGLHAWITQHVGASSRNPR